MLQDPVYQVPAFGGEIGFLATQLFGNPHQEIKVQPMTCHIILNCGMGSLRAKVHYKKSFSPLIAYS
jgi:hypothetical protein